MNDERLPSPRLRLRGPRRSPKLTADMASKMKTRVLHRGEAQHDVAAHFRVNQGRVSEVVTGKAFPDAPFASLDDLD
jgi:hypothetical protein